MDSKQLRFQDKNLKSERVEKLSEGEMAGNTPQLEKDVNPQTSIEPSVQVKCPGDILQGGRHAKRGRWMASWKGFHLGRRDSDCKMNITVDQDTDYAELVLSVGEITLGEKTRDSMKDSQLRRKEAKSILQAVCTLLNSGGGVVKAHIKNQNYSFTRDGMGLDLVNPCLVSCTFLMTI